MILLSEVR
jgi:hypothetical protein